MLGYEKLETVSRINNVISFFLLEVQFKSALKSGDIIIIRLHIFFSKSKAVFLIVFHSWRGTIF